MRKRFDMAILGAVGREVEPLAVLLDHREEVRLCGAALRSGSIRGLSVLIGASGFNKVNAAITVAALLERFSISQVWNVGCAGAYGNGPLDIGDVLITESALCGDEGIMTEEGFASPEGIGIPILARGEHVFHDRIPLAPQPAMEKVRAEIAPGLYCLRGDGGAPHRALPCSATCAAPDGEGLLQAGGDFPASSERPFRVLYGPSLTVSMVSGDDFIAGRRFETYGAFAENMEGSAMAQACFRFDVPFVECRGISNIAGDRCKERWRLDTAVAHSHGVLLKWIDASA